MRRNAVHGALAVAALAAAFLAYRHGRLGPDGGEAPGQAGVLLASLARADLVGLLYESESRTVEIDLSSESPPYWVTVTTRTKVPSRPPRPPARATPDGGSASDGGPAGDGRPTADGDAGSGGGDDGGSGAIVEPTPERETREERSRFVANAALDDMLGSLAPLRVVRRLGKVPASRLAEFDLVEPAATLTLELARGRRVLKLGGRTFGGGDHYALDETSGEVVLLASALVRDVELAGTRLVQRELHRFGEEEVASVVVSIGERRRTLEQRNRRSPADRAWVDPAQPDVESEQRANWMAALSRLRALSFLLPEEQPADAAPLLRVDYRGERGEELGFLEVVRLGPEGPGAEYLGRSEATAVWVRLARSSAEGVVGDASEVVGP